VSYFNYVDAATTTFWGKVTVSAWYFGACCDIEWWTVQRTWINWTGWWTSSQLI